jgi:hypothetical protein
MFTIKQGNKTLSVLHNKRHYIIGFKNKILARKVYYNIHPSPQFTLVRDQDIDLSAVLKSNGFDISLSLDVGATLFVPKCKGSILDPMNDGGFHLSMVPEHEFLAFPIEHRLGVVMPYDLEDETLDEFMFKASVLEP